MYRRMKRAVISGCMVLSLVMPSVQVSAQENAGAYVDESADKIEIGNPYIARSFLVEDGHVLPGTVENRRIGQTLTAEEGAELFLLNTLFEAEGEETIPQEALVRSQWKGEVSCEDSSQVKDAALMFDGDKNTDVDYYVTGTDFPYRSFGYQKRKGDANAAWGINGTAGQYDLEVSLNGEDWQAAGSGEFTREDYNIHEEDGLYNVGDMVYGSFDQAYTARYVRFICRSGALSAEKTFNGAEFYLYSDEYVPVEKPETEIRSRLETALRSLREGGFAVTKAGISNSLIGLYEDLLRTAENEMAVVAYFIKLRLKDLGSINPLFFTEMEKYERIVSFFRTNSAKQTAHSQEFMRSGIEHGFFRSDLNYDIINMMGDAAMNYVMRTRLYEKYKLNEIFHTFVIVFMRGCCTEKGLAYLDKFVEEN